MEKIDQTLLTTTDLKLFLADFVGNAKVWQVEAGKVQEVLVTADLSVVIGGAMRVKHASDVEAQTVKGGNKTTIQVLISSQEEPNFAMRRFVIKRGGGMPNHTNTVEHEQFVLRGHAWISINGQGYEVRGGDVVFIPEGAPHWYQNNGDEDFEFLCIVPNKKDEVRIVNDKSC